MHIPASAFERQQRVYEPLIGLFCGVGVLWIDIIKCLPIAYRNDNTQELDDGVP